MSEGLRIAFADRTAGLGEQFAQHGRVQIRKALREDSAERIHRCLVDHREWNLVYRLAGRHVAASAGAVAKWPATKRRKLEKAIYAEAQQDFQYFFASVPIYDIVHQRLLPGHFFEAVLGLVNSAEMLAAVRSVTGDESIAFADAQATRYERGHFLSVHDDAVEGKSRRAAYVLNLTPFWRAEWGGALEFFGRDGNVEEAWLPEFNVLNLLRVPVRHAVSFVTPFAAAARFAITGWFRSGADPGC